MDLLSSIFDVLMKFPVFKSDTESDEGRAARMHIVADAISDSEKRAACVDEPADCKPIFSDRRMLAALLLGKGEEESGFAQYVHEGRCEEGPTDARCDRDAAGHVRAHSPWQIWLVAAWPHDDWFRMNEATPESTHLAAWQATRLLAGARSLCRNEYHGDDVQAAVAGFSGGCHLMRPEKIARQAARIRKIMARLPAE